MALPTNVCINLYRGDELIDSRVGHNIWVDLGREYLAKLISLVSMDVDVSLEDRRIAHIGLGVGSKYSLAVVPPVSTSYPPGFDPYGTAGNEYDSAYPAGVPIGVPIESLERPIRITGGSAPYPGNPGTDIWLTQPIVPRFVIGHDTPHETVFRAMFDTNPPYNEILYGPFTMMPLSEIGLFLSGVDVSLPYEHPNIPPGTPSKLVAYHPFATLRIIPGTRLEIAWHVQF